MKNPKRPRDVNQLAKMIVDISTGNAPPDPERQKNPAAVALGRLGGAKGGKARAAALSPAKRKAIATKAAEKRWSRDQVGSYAIKTSTWACRRGDNAAIEWLLRVR